MNTEKMAIKMLKQNHGLTLVELLVGVLIFAIATAGIWTTFNSQNRIFHSQQQVAMVQQNIRAAMYVMEKQLRMAGYDPDTKGYGISSIANNAITFGYDDSIGGSITRSFGASGSNLMMNADVLTENIYVSGGINGFAVAYAFDDDGDGRLDTVDGSPSGNIIWAIDTDNNNFLDLRLDTNNDGNIDINDDTTGNDGIIDGVVLNPQIKMASIRAVRIWVLAQADKPDPYYQENRTYVVGRNIITTNDRFRRMILSTIVKCRNIGA